MFLVSDCRFGVSPVNYPDITMPYVLKFGMLNSDFLYHVCCVLTAHNVEKREINCDNNYQSVIDLMFYYAVII